MGLGRGFQVIHGSYIDPTESYESTAITAVLINFGLVYICMTFSRSAMNTLKYMAKLDDVHFSLLWTRGVIMYFVVIPMALSVLGKPIKTQPGCVYFNKHLNQF